MGPLRVDLRRWCSPIENQGNIGSCTANAVVGAYEYFQRRTVGEHLEGSRLFLYRATRRFLGWEGKGDTGAFIRSTIKALRLFGVPPEEYWPYVESDFDREPEAFHYSFAQNFQAIQYFRLDETINHLKSALDSGLPFAFGFTCFTSMFTDSVTRSGVIPYPTSQERVEGGHAVLAVGYTDSHVLIRNSWGKDWGVGGYGFLPWTFFDRNRPLATDCWVLVNTESVADEVRPSTAARRERFRAPGAREERPDSALVHVVRGTDPVGEIPVRLTSEGVQHGQAGLRMGLNMTAGKVSVDLRGMSLTPSFDFSLLGPETGELFLFGLVWDLSGDRPRAFPGAERTTPEQVKGMFRENGGGGEIRFAAGGLRLWPARPVVGAMYIRLMLVESGEDTEELTQTLRGVQAMVDRSELASILAGLGGAPEATMLGRVDAAARALVSQMAEALGDRDNRVISILDGTYGADTLVRGRTEFHDQLGAEIELNIELPDQVKAAAVPHLTALQQMQMTIAEARGRAFGTGAEGEAGHLAGRSEEPSAQRKPTGPRA